MSERETNNLVTIAKRRVGRPPASASGGWQDPGPRGRYLIEKYGMAQIQDWYQILKSPDATNAQKKSIPLSTGDCLLIGRIARAQTSEDSLELLHNRTFGKVPDRSINLNINAGVDPEKLSEQAAEMLARLGE